jgi:hypothetical protein
MKRCVTLLACAVIVVSALPAEAREGFGSSKRAVQLDRRVPPEILLVATRIEVRVGDDGGFAVASRQLRDLVERTMLANEARLVKDKDRPEIVVEIDIDALRTSDTVRQKTEYETRQVVVPSVDSKGRQSTKLIHKSVPVAVNYIDVSGAVESKFRVVDATTKREIFRATESADYFESFKLGDGAPTTTELEKMLVTRVASQIATKLVGATEPVSVLVPRGSFERVIPLADRGDWAAYEWEIEAMPPLKRPADDAFRQYALAVASEALAYRAKDEAEAIDRLRRAADLYRKAIALNPGEEFFAKAHSRAGNGAAASPVERVDSILASYGKLQEFRAQLAAAPASPAPPIQAVPARTEKSSATVSAKGKTSELMKNDDVIELAKAGFGDEFIILAIDAASSVQFDLTPQGLSGMTKAGVSPAVIAHIQKTRK